MTIDILALKRYNLLGVVFWRRSSIQTEKKEHFLKLTTLLLERVA